jgi:hypothetical protein
MQFDAIVNQLKEQNLKLNQLLTEKQQKFFAKDEKSNSF